MAANDTVDPKNPEEPWWSQAVAGGGADSATKAPSAYSGFGGAAQTSALTDMPSEFGRYRARKKLGGGGMGAVYLVENTELKREEALKVPHFGVGGDPDVRERFFREARAAAQLDHPNLCPVYDVGTINGVCFLTMRYLKGKLLSDFTGKAQPPRKAVEITAKLAQALESAHIKGVIHRDLKPNNVMMCAGVGPVVMDFGLAKQTKGEDQKLTQAGTTMGTPSYMPPEQVKGELDRIGPPSDVYSLGVILFEMLTGRLPFKAATVAEIYGKILHTDAPAPSSLRPGLNPALDAICAKALAKEPEGRYPSMKAFAAVLIEFLKAAPATEGAGNLTPTKAAPADIFQAPTVAPNQAATAPPSAPGEATLRGNKAPSSVIKPASTHRANPQATVSGTKEKKGRSVTRRLVLPALILLILGAIGGVGFLVYSLNQKKAVPSADLTVTAALTAPSEKEKTPRVLKVEGSKAGIPVEETFQAEPPQIDPIQAEKRPRAAPPRPVIVHRNPAPRSGPTKAPPPAEFDPPSIDPPKPVIARAPKPEKPGEKELLNEDFTGLEVGSRPKGWVGEAFGVATEEKRPCLEITKDSTTMSYVTLPKLAIKGDFEMDCEFRLGGGNAQNGFIIRRTPTVGHDFRLELISPGSAPLRVHVDYLGNVRIDAGQAKRAEGFKPFESNTLHLTRKGDVYNVSINDSDAIVGQNLPRLGVFQIVKIGLTGGKPPLGTALACLYSVKIASTESPDPAPVPVKTTAPPPVIREDFAKAADGGLPNGWVTVGKKANIAVRKTNLLTALELVNPTQGSDMVTLPKVELNGGFSAALSAVLVEQGTDVKVFFKNDKTKQQLVVQLDYGGAVTVTGGPKIYMSGLWREGKPNVLRIEHSRKDADYVIKLNDGQVASAPATTAPGPFTRMELAIDVIKEAKQLSPQVTSVEIVPLDEGP